jgi:predicted nucleic acid-binding protein
MYLLDTNVIFEYRKKQDANPGVINFFKQNSQNDLYLCVQVIGEIQAGIQKLVDNGDTVKAKIYQDWLQDDLLINFPGRILPFDLDAARIWGKLNSGVKKDPHTADRQIAAIALTRWSMTVVTRDVSSPGFQSGANYGLSLLNPFA